MGLGDLGGLLDVGEEILPGGGEALVRLGFGSTFDQGFDNPFGGDLFAATVEDLLLKLGDQRISFVADADGELRHGWDAHLYYQ